MRIFLHKTFSIIQTFIVRLKGVGAVQCLKSWKHDFEITGDPKGPPSGSTFWSGFEALFRVQKSKMTNKAQTEIC